MVSHIKAVDKWVLGGAEAPQNFCLWGALTQFSGVGTIAAVAALAATLFRS